MRTAQKISPIVPKPEQKELAKATTKSDDEEKPKKKQAGPRRIKGDANKKITRKESKEELAQEAANVQVVVFFSSLTGHTERTAQEFAKTLNGALTQGVEEKDQASCPFLTPQVLDLAEIDYDEIQEGRKRTRVSLCEPLDRRRARAGG